VEANGGLLIEVNDLCDDCGEEHEPYMMEDEVWESILVQNDPEDLVLCFGCFGERLGREIEPSDFMNCELNQPWYGYIINLWHKRSIDHR